MKIQDIIFILIFILLIYKQNSRLAVLAGIILIFMSLPLFAKWIFFTAEHLVWYAAAFFLLGIFLELIGLNKDHKK